MAKSDLRPAPDLLPPGPKNIYTLTNDPLDNQVVSISHAANGTMTTKPGVSTAGRGAGGGLGSQGALIFHKATNRFFAVNAGDSSISMLGLKADGTPELQFRRLSGGTRPVSITTNLAGDVVYVVHVGDSFEKPSIVGFRVVGTMLMLIQNSMMELSAAMAGPAQIQFTPDSALLIATEKATHKIDTFTVSNGLASAPNVQASNGMTPFGFAFSATGKLIVSEAAMGGAGAGSTSSYSVAANGTLTSVSSKVASGQTAPCWVAVSGTTAFVTNAQTNNITAYRVGADGSLTLLAGGNSGMTGMGPTDVAVTEANDYLYTLNSGDHSFSAFSIAADGTLTKKPDLTGAPMFAVGLVAR